MKKDSHNEEEKMYYIDSHYKSNFFSNLNEVDFPFEFELTRVNCSSYCRMQIDFFFSILPESVRWMTVHGKTKEAKQVFKKIAKFNKKEWQDVTLVQMTQGKKTVSAKYLFRPWSTLTSTLIQAVAW